MKQTEERNGAVHAAKGRKHRRLLLYRRIGAALLAALAVA